MRRSFEIEKIGDGDVAVRVRGQEFPLMFLCNRFTTSGWDIYKVPDLKQYQDFLYNDEFVRVGTPHKSVTWAKTKSEAIKKAQELLKEFGKGARRKHAGIHSSRGYEKRVRQGHY
jgi:hypothetical protein